jgi:hypothetical protein
LEEGKDVAVRGIIQDGRFLASRIGEGNPEKSQAKTREIQLEGRVESLWRDPRGRVSRISVNGLVVSISGNTTLSGPLSGGELVAVRGQRQAGGLTATEIQVRPPEAAQAPRTSFRIQGVVAEVQKDSKGKLRGLVLDGKAIVLEGLIQVDRRVAVGAVVDVRGVMAGEVYVASLVKVVEQPKANGENRQQENSQGRRNDRRQDRDEEPDQNGNGGKGGE